MCWLGFCNIIIYWSKFWYLKKENSQKRFHYQKYIWAIFKLDIWHATTMYLWNIMIWVLLHKFLFSINAQTSLAIFPQFFCDLQSREIGFPVYAQTTCSIWSNLISASVLFLLQHIYVQNYSNITLVTIIWKRWNEPAMRPYVIQVFENLKFNFFYLYAHEPKVSKKLVPHKTPPLSMLQKYSQILIRRPFPFIPHTKLPRNSKNWIP